jgi:acyl-CoA thioester hydrolase
MRLKALALEAFPFKTSDKIRYRDTDRQGHINNAVFGTYFETGRVELLYTKEFNILPEGASFVVAHVSMDLIAEIHWPGFIDIGVGVLRIGNSSLVIGSNLFQNGTLVASSETIVVQVDNLTKKPRSLEETSRLTLNQFLLNIS